MFEINHRLLKETKKILDDYPNIYWVIGGACSGKTTVTTEISTRLNIELYDMDAHVYGSYGGLYTQERHPAIKTWFSAENPLAWIMALTEVGFDSLNRASNAEFLDLFAKDLLTKKTTDVLMVDGGISHPSVLAKVLPVERILCLDIDTKISRALWNEAPERQEMKGWLLALPEGKMAWEKFLRFDALITRTMLRESLDLGIRVVERREGVRTKDLGEEIAGYFNL